MGDPGRQFSEGGHASDVSKRRLRLLHRLFGPLGRGDIHHGSNEGTFSRFGSQGMRDNMEIFHQTIRHQQPMLQIVVFSIARFAFDELSDAFDVFRMSSVNDRLDCGAGPSIEPKYLKRFV